MVSSASVDISLKSADELITAAAGESPEAIFLPENFAALASGDPLAIGREELTTSGPIRSFLADAARRANCWIFAGTLPIAARPDGSAVPGDRVRAASLMYDADGSEVARYDKMHMFDVEVEDNQRRYMESATFESGEDIVWIDTPIGRVGLTVCYDIRFPELYRRLFTAGCDLVAIPSAFTETTGEAHFELLMRARAVENSCFTVAACQGGAHDSGRRTWGHSMVVDPWGNIVGELDKGEGVLTVELDMEQLATVRRDMPFLAQRKLT